MTGWSVVYALLLGAVMLIGMGWDLFWPGQAWCGPASGDGARMAVLGVFGLALVMRVLRFGQRAGLAECGVFGLCALVAGAGLWAAARDCAGLSDAHRSAPAVLIAALAGVVLAALVLVRLRRG
ncbi:hypothetical protein [Paracoccus jiaweipingae]|uniref:hypothetical protein n=1 Tax=unclassified Paracoccus (in: a-proteobacteria) TaxID=2688777 RepID=UPI0037A6585F